MVTKPVRFMNPVDLAITYPQHTDCSATIANVLRKRGHAVNGELTKIYRKAST